MADVTDYPFRHIAKKCGAGLTFTQMVSADGVIKNNFDTLRLLTYSQTERPIGVQLLGKDPDILGRAVKELVRLKPTVIDLNCGCPVEKVFSHKMGAYLLSQPMTLAKIVEAMVKNAEGIPISVKIRLGHKNKVNVLENARIIEENGASLITVHARTRNDKYDVDADWEWISKVKSILNIPVIGNGSVFEAEDAVKMLQDTNCDGVLIGRGVLGNPFIFRQIEQLIRGNKIFQPEISEIRDTALEHLLLLENEQGYSINLDKAKKNIIWYFKYQNGIESLISAVYSADNFEKLKNVVLEHSNKLLESFYPQQDKEEIRQKFKKRVLFWLAKEEEKVS